jgi:hypothetical protein
MMRTDRKLLADVAALAEVNPPHHVHVAFKGKRRLADYLGLAFRYTVQHSTNRVHAQIDLGASNLSLIRQMDA